MIKTDRHFWLFSLVGTLFVLLLVGLASCSSNNDELDNNQGGALHGTWTTNSVYYIASGLEGQTAHSTRWDRITELTFGLSGKVTVKYIDTDEYLSNQKTYGPYDYKYETKNGNTLLVYGTNPDQPDEPSELTYNVENGELILKDISGMAWPDIEGTLSKFVWKRK